MAVILLKLVHLGSEDKVQNFDNKFREVKWAGSPQVIQMNTQDYILL